MKAPCKHCHHLKSKHTQVIPSYQWPDGSVSVRYESACKICCEQVKGCWQYEPLDNLDYIAWRYKKMKKHV